MNHLRILVNYRFRGSRGRGGYRVEGGEGKFCLLTKSQVRLTLPAHGPHSEQQGSRARVETAAAPTPVLLPGNPRGWGAWWAAVHGVAEGRTRLSDFTFTFHVHALEKEMATHSSVLAWRIPGTAEPGGLPSMGSQSRTRLK